MQFTAAQNLQRFLQSSVSRSHTRANQKSCRASFPPSLVLEPDAWPEGLNERKTVRERETCTDVRKGSVLALHLLRCLSLSLSLFLSLFLSLPLTLSFYLSIFLFLPPSLCVCKQAPGPSMGGRKLRLGGEQKHLKAGKKGWIDRSVEGRGEVWVLISERVRRRLCVYFWGAVCVWMPSAL